MNRMMKNNIQASKNKTKKQSIDALILYVSYFLKILSNKQFWYDNRLWSFPDVCLVLYNKSIIDMIDCTTFEEGCPGEQYSSYNMLQCKRLIQF